MPRWLLFILAFHFSNSASAHDGWLQSNGCHAESIWSHESDEYHCHQGPFAGQSFESVAAYFSALLAIENPPFSGPAKVIDGDTLEIKGVRVRLFGIDAPEMDQTCEWPRKTIACGQIAKAAVQDLLVGGGEVTCYPNDFPVEKDDNESVVAICVASDGFDIGQNLVHTGWAIALQKHSMRYSDVADAAKVANRGLWHGKFVLPWNWRRGER